MKSRPVIILLTATADSAIKTMVSDLAVIKYSPFDAKVATALRYPATICVHDSKL